LIQKNRVCQKQNPAKSTPWIPAFAGMTIFSAFPQANAEKNRPLFYYKCLGENARNGQPAVRFHVQSWARTISASKSPGFAAQQGKSRF